MRKDSADKVTLRELLQEAGIGAAVAGDAAGARVVGIDYDSRRVGPDYVFFAFAGAKTDGARFAADALRRGAAAVVSESAAPADFPGVWIRVEHGRQAMALMARKLYAEAAEQAIVTGATGTNGKTTTCTLIDALLRHAGKVTALAGTIGYHVAGETRPAINTTPESVDLYRMLEELQKAGGRHLTMEVSSHALALGRVYGVRFHTAVWTNLTRDHLDFHESMENYFAAKAELFAGQAAAPPRFAVLNADDAWAERLSIASGTETVWYGTSSRAALRAADVKASFEGLRFRIEWEGRSWKIVSPLASRVNVYNVLAAFGAGLTLGLEPEQMVEGVAACKAVPGRFERVDCGQPFLVVVDYAHTDDALRNTIQAARALGNGRVVTLFGCGGDRDRAKRPLMGQAAAELSDYVVLTSDNPRSEDPLAIMNDALVGLRRKDTPHAAEPDRAKAIRLALAEARPGDIVLLAGKGHETYQVLRDRTIHFDDREVAREVLAELGYGCEEKR